ncbi:hypothetical protein V2S66_18940 [Streptomyces sp. V4-01]|uniref:Uncharacterized protein n=1 Tax=Actinacidiphila polyblastidii TaxID=3110430 RepID=A0ABU7PE03_9ACTN|nr:hypothetical protein [Streptomyces sp. V4-01]
MSPQPVYRGSHGLPNPWAAHPGTHHRPGRTARRRTTPAAQSRARRRPQTTQSRSDTDHPRTATAHPGASPALNPAPTFSHRKALTSINPANHRLLLDRLTVYTRAAAHILQQWHDYSDQHTDAQGWPLDEDAYGLRQRRRDAETWHAFERVRPHMGELLTVAERQLAALPAAEQQSHWRGTLTRLEQARTGLETTYTYWRAECDALLPTSGPGTEAYDEPLAERNAEAWSYLCDWADGGHVLNRIARAAIGQRPDAAGRSAGHTRTQDGAPLPPRGPGLPHPGPDTRGR